MWNPKIPAKIQLAHFDMAGTTIDDEVGDISSEFGGKPLPIIIDGFQYGLARIGITAPFDVINKYRGAEKIDALYKIISELMPDIDSDDDRRYMARQAHDYFIKRGIQLAERVHAKGGISDLYKRLKDNGVYIVVATGFTDEITKSLISNLAWLDKGYVDLVVSSEKAGGGRPLPNMINFALRSARYQ